MWLHMEDLVPRPSASFIRIEHIEIHITNKYHMILHTHGIGHMTNDDKCDIYLEHPLHDKLWAFRALRAI